MGASWAAAGAAGAVGVARAAESAVVVVEPVGAAAENAAPRTAAQHSCDSQEKAR
jgi:hypothetical protein